MGSENQTRNANGEETSRNKETSRGERKLQRRKIALACEPCRERKSRCDGRKPICGSCHRRAFTLEQCVYKADNARSASNDAYIKVLHNRIRELEQTCVQFGAAIPNLNSELAGSEDHPQQRGALDPSTAGETLNNGIDERDTEPGARSVLDPTISGPGIADFVEEQRRPVFAPLSTATNHPPVTEQSSKLTIGAPPDIDGITQVRIQSGPDPNLRNDLCSPAENSGVQNSQPSRIRASFHDKYPTGPPSEDPDSLSSPNAQGPVTAMGAISVVNEEGKESDPRKDYYGSSSAASFMRLARESSRLHSEQKIAMHAVNQHGGGTINPHCSEPTWRDFCKPTQQLQYEHFSLPPRPLADHLLQCYFNRVHWLYPFFHRPSFEAAYENLWAPSNQAKNTLPTLNIGLGSSHDSGKYSRVFYCALNAMLALGCHFSDIPAEEREVVAHSFFLRSKQLVGVEILEISTIGVVQTFLIAALYLQSTPYPNRCWNSIGLACRVAQGIGLHAETGQDHAGHLELQIGRRTWHGCVMMDLVVSMTLGRPSMTSHLPNSPLPSSLSDRDLMNGESSYQRSENSHSHMVFYVYTIELYKILDDIMSEVYMAWRNGTGRHPPAAEKRSKQAGLDVIIDIDSKLCDYEATLPPFLSWADRGRIPDGLDDTETAMYRCQTNVLHARYLHLRLLLYRPIFTQLWAARGGSNSSTSKTDGNPVLETSNLGTNMLYSSFAGKCAAACIMAAIDLVELIHGNYLTPETSAWWYNGLYVSTASIVLIMCRSCPSVLDQIEVSRIESTWLKCMEILSHMASFSISGRNTLKVLQSMYSQLSAGNSSYGASSQQRTGCRREEPPVLDPHFNLAPGLNENQANPFQTEMLWQGGSSFMNWDGAMNYVPDEFGLFGPSDIPGPSSWFPDIPG